MCKLNRQFTFRIDYNFFEILRTKAKSRNYKQSGQAKTPHHAD